MGMRAIWGALAVVLILLGSGGAYADKADRPAVADAAAVALSGHASGSGGPQIDTSDVDTSDLDTSDIDASDSEEACTDLTILRGPGTAGPPEPAGRSANGPHTAATPPVPPPKGRASVVHVPIDPPHGTEPVISCQSADPDSEVCTILVVWRGVAAAAPVNSGPLAQAPYASIDPPVPPPKPSATATASLFAFLTPPTPRGGRARRDIFDRTFPSAAPITLSSLRNFGFSLRQASAQRQAFAQRQALAQRQAHAQRQASAQEGRPAAIVRAHAAAARAQRAPISNQHQTGNINKPSGTS